jgi:hypothetical protein
MLFGQRYLLVTIDEGHLFRNVGPKHWATLVIVERGLLRLIMMATPLHTSMKVSFLCFILEKILTSEIYFPGCFHDGTSCWHSPLFSEQGFKEEKEGAAAQWKACKVLLEEEMYLEDDSPETRALRVLSVGVAVRMQKQFEEGNLSCDYLRTNKSLEFLLSLQRV